jgi:enolase
LSLPADLRNDALKFIFASWQGALISLIFIWLACHSAIAIHEMGHYLKAVKLDALNAKLLPEAKANMTAPLPKRILWYIKMFALIPTGRFPGVVKNGLNYYPDSPFNLAVSASGPSMSRTMALCMLPFAVGLLVFGIVSTSDVALKGDVLKCLFASWETLISLAFLWFTCHTAIAIHEMGHYLKAVKVDALNAKLLPQAKANMSAPLPKRILWYLKMYALIPTGRFPGVIKNGLNFYADAPFNLAVSASGPRTSRILSIIFFPLAIGLISLGMTMEIDPAVYAGRLCLGLATVGLLDFFIADPGKYKEFRAREKKAREKAQTVEKVSGWYTAAQQVKQRMLTERTQWVQHPTLGKVTVPWQFRNCGMGGKHTEKEYPESNISMQEAMFVILGVKNWQEAQEMTVRLQNRLKEIIEKEEGSRVMGIGLEGGLAPYIEKAQYPLPEVRLWSMMKQAIEECGYQAGKDVAIGLDPAMSELESAYRKEYNMPDAIGMYLFWRDKAKISLDRDGVLAIYKDAIQKYEIPIISIEDGFAEDDPQGWKMILKELGDRIWVIGDDLVTTNDKTIEMASRESLINTSLIKANQIGTLYETILAMLVALGKGQELVISHRSKSPNDDMETQIALAVNSLGLKAGGGANTERLFKYQSGIVLMRKLEEGLKPISLKPGEEAIIRKFTSYEESTNAGIPTVGVEIEVDIPSVGAVLKFKGATPLGTSAGTGEAIHLVDSLIEYSEHKDLIDKHPDLFQKTEGGVYSFNKKTGDAQVKATQDAKLIELFRVASRYEGKGCLNAVSNVLNRIAPQFEGKNLTTLTLRDIDTTLLKMESDLAIERGKLTAGNSDAQTLAMQRKQNLGMNAILSVSLALARAVAHIRGKELYGLIREEVFSIIDSLAKDYKVQIKGKEVSDYIAALREVNNILEKQNKPLFEALRQKTNIYTGSESSSMRQAAAADEAKPQKRSSGDKNTDQRSALERGWVIANHILVSLHIAITASVLSFGLGATSGAGLAVYFGRLCFALTIIGLLDFFIADPGKYKEFRAREKKAREKAQTVEKVSGWYTAAQQVKQRMLTERTQWVQHPTLGKVTVPWQFRNCGMGGKHTEKEYPESNISMQEAMFVILGVKNWQEAQEMTVRLQNRLKEIIEKEEGSRVMGIGLEGGLAPYIEKAQYPLPEVRLWSMMKQAIEECGYQAGKDVAIGLDPAMSELESAYRKEYNMPDAIGMYLFWRDKAKISLDRDGVLAIYKDAIQKYEIPIISIEDGFAEDDPQGWKMILKELGDRIWVIGDDLVTTNDKTIEMASRESLINTSLIKANQIGTLYETILAMLVALGKGQELVISHRSKSPNDDMETQIALAVNSLGLKAGGGANTERLFKYQSGIVLMRKLEEGLKPISLKPGEEAIIRKFTSYEESTNAGIPTVGVEIEVDIPSVGAVLKFKGATPLGTSAGTGEAIHLVDSLIEYSEHKDLIDKHPDLFQKTEGGVYSFNKKTGDAQVKATQDAKLIELFRVASRYEGKGCLNAVSNVLNRIAPQFEGKNLTTLTLRDIDTTLLKMESDLAIERGKLTAGNSDAQTLAMQRKQNLGMNAILSVSLALARAVAHIRGKELYGLIREEVFSIIDSLAKDYKVQIKGKEVSDYIAALREVNNILEKQNKPLFEALRQKTNIYDTSSKP